MCWLSNNTDTVVLAKSNEQWAIIKEFHNIIHKKSCALQQFAQLKKKTAHIKLL